MTCKKNVAVHFHPASSPDYLPAAQLHALQSQRLREVVTRAYERIDLYRTRMDALGVKPEMIRGIEDIVRLPFVMKTDLRDTYPFGLFASPMQDVVRLHASSGTTGKPIVVAYTQNDIGVWANVILRALVSYGLSRRRHHSELLRLWAVYRRPGPSLRC